MDKELATLNSCPICGCSVRVWAKRFDEEDMEYIIECDNDFCGLTYGISCGYNRDEIKKAWNSVIALSSTVSEDCISREYILSFLDGEVMGDDDYIAGMNDEQREIREVVRNAPSVTPTERTGEWKLPVNSFSENMDYMWCSNCGHKETRFIHANNFCPNCGANMRGDE